MTQLGAGGSVAPPGPPPGPPQPPPGQAPEPRPPAGPGVVAPFPAPPRERNPRLWIGLGAAALAVVLAIAAVVVGLLLVAAATSRHAVDTADQFLSAVQHQHYDQAYRMECQVLRQRQSSDEFRGQFAGSSRLVSYRLADTPETGSQGEYRVRAVLRFVGGQQRQAHVVVVQDGEASSGFSVCGFTR